MGVEVGGEVDGLVDDGVQMGVGRELRGANVRIRFDPLGEGVYCVVAA